MFGIFKDILDTTADVVGTVLGIAIAPIAITLGVSERLVRRAVQAGCKTEKEIEEWINDNS